MSNAPVLHLFNQYLPQSENWAYHLISNIPNTQIFIAAKEYLKNNFYNPKFTFFENPHALSYSLRRKLKRTNTKDLLSKGLLKLLEINTGNPCYHILQQARKHQIQLVHAHFADVAWFYRDIPAQLKTPFVISFYGWDYEMLHFIRPAFKQRLKKLFQFADLIICEGQHGAEILKRKGCPPHKIAIVPLGVQTEQIPYFKRAKTPNELKLLQIANFTEKKGHIWTVQAFAMALDLCPNMHLTLMGNDKNGMIKTQIKQDIVDRNLQHRISILEAVDFSRLHHIMQHYHVFIHPSCYAQNRDCEGGAPIVLLDAQATGMPIISTRHCDIESEVIHGETGLLAAEKDVSGLAKAIAFFYQLKEIDYLRWSENAKRHVKKHYNININANALYDHYATIINSNPTII